MTTDLTPSSRAERIADLQSHVDEAEGRLPIPKGMPHMVVGTWLALVASFLQTGGVPVDSPWTVGFGVLAAAGWGVVVYGGARYASARLRLRRLRKELAELLGSGPDAQPKKMLASSVTTTMAAIDPQTPKRSQAE